MGELAPSRARISPQRIHRSDRIGRHWGLFALARRNENFPQPLAVAELYGVFAVPLFLTLFFLAVVTFAGISSRWTNDEDREWWGRAAGWLLAVVVGWMLISGLVIFGPLLLSRTISLLSAGGVAGLITILAGRSTLLPKSAGERDKAGPLVLILSKAVTIAAFIFIAVLMIVITRAMTWMMSQ